MALVLALVGLAGCPDTGVAAGSRDLADGWLFGATATANLLRRGPVPPQRLWVSLGETRLYGLAELPVAEVTLGLRDWFPRGRSALELGWQTLGRGLYRETDRHLDLQWGRRIMVGGRMRMLLVRTGGLAGFHERRDSFWQLDATLQANWDRGPDVGLRVRLDLPLAETDFLRVRDGRRRLLAVQGWRAPTGFAVSVDTKPDQTPTIGLEWLMAWGHAVWGARLEPSVGVVGLVLSLARGRLLLRTSHLVHPQLGLTHRFQVGFGSGGGSTW